MAATDTTTSSALPALSLRAWRLAPVLAAALAGTVYLMLAPKTGDLPAHVFRAKLFGRAPFTVWNGNWYGGHHTPAYSVLFPPLAWLLGPAVAGTLAALGAAAAFEPLARWHFGSRARWGALWFGVGTSSMLLDGQLPFVLGVALGLVALLAMQRGVTWLAVLLALLCPLGSPVAGMFLALAALAYALGKLVWPPRLEPERLRAVRPAVLVGLAAFLPPILLALAFPEGGQQPYALSAFIPVPVAALGFVLLLSKEDRMLRTGAAIYGLGALAAFALPTPFGGNASRLGTVFGGPLAACVALGPRRPALRPLVVAVLLLGLAYWQFGASVRNVSSEDASRYGSYYHPLLEFLEAHKKPPGRLEVVFTHSNWDAADVGIHWPLARGWERQLDVSRNSLFYDDDHTLNARTYERWLDENAVRWVALPDVALDYSAKREAQLVRGGLPYLALRWRSAHWRVYEVMSPHPLVVPQGRARISAGALATTRVRLRVERPGSAIVRVHWTPYWIAHGACVERAGTWTRVIASKPGNLLLRIEFSLERMFEHGRRCN